MYATYSASMHSSCFPVTTLEGTISPASGTQNPSLGDDMFENAFQEEEYLGVSGLAGSANNNESERNQNSIVPQQDSDSSRLHANAYLSPFSTPTEPQPLPASDTTSCASECGLSQLMQADLYVFRASSHLGLSP